MNKNLIVRSLAAVSGLAMLASLAACGDNVAATTDSTSTKDLSSQISGDYAGAGASSQQAAVEAWIAGFKGSNLDAKIAYNPSGSGAGVTTFLQGATAWAGSDKALADDEVEQSKNVCAKGTAFDVPVYVSPIAVVFNLKGVSDQGKHVNMDASTIAKIFDGKITKWNDAAIKSQNPKLNLPDTDITVVHRSDKSGTTQNFVSYFKDAAPNDWTYDLSENWPNEVGQGAKGTSGVINTVKQADGTIGYADFSRRRPEDRPAGRRHRAAAEHADLQDRRLHQGDLHQVSRSSQPAVPSEVGAPGPHVGWEESDSAHCAE